MHRDEILEQLENTRIQLLELLEPIPNEVLIEPGAFGDWSIADVLAHIAAWESELVTMLLQIDRGQKPEKWLTSVRDIDGYNHQRYLENQGRAPDRIFDDLQGVRRQLEGWLEEFDDRQLNDPKAFGWAKGNPLWLIIKESSFGHEAEHIEEINSFLMKGIGSDEG